MTAFLMHEGRIVPILAQVRQSGIPAVLVEVDGHPVLVPLALAVEAPSRTRPTLVWSNPDV